MSVSPRCTVHGYSVNEFRPVMLHARAFYRREFADSPNCEELVSKKLDQLMTWAGITCACGRNMVLNADTRADFYARRDAYPADAQS